MEAFFAHEPSQIPKKWVITSGGLYGRITGITDTVVTLEISEKVRVKVGRGNIAGLAQTDTPVKPKGS